MVTPVEPVLINRDGSMNSVAWCAWYRATKGGSPNMAQQQFNEHLRALPEPDIRTKSGKVSKHWVTWYKVRKNVSTGVAASVARRRINCIDQGKKPLEEHLTTWW